MHFTRPRLYQASCSPLVARAFAIDEQVPNKCGESVYWDHKYHAHNAALSRWLRVVHEMLGRIAKLRVRACTIHG